MKMRSRPNVVSLRETNRTNISRCDLIEVLRFRHWNGFEAGSSWNAKYLSHPRIERQGQV
jgi:hypothetical protein